MNEKPNQENGTKAAESNTEIEKLQHHLDHMGVQLNKLNQTVYDLSQSQAKIGELAEKSNFAVKQLDGQILKGRENEVYLQLFFQKSLVINS